MRANQVVLAVLLVTGPMLSGCVATATMPPLPPPPQAEIVSKPPVSDQALVWQPGHWDQMAGGYAWTPGTWVAQAGHGRLWQEGAWSNITGPWVWMPARWVEG